MAEYDEYGDPIGGPSHDIQCNDCYTFSRGPHQGQNPGYKVAHIDESGRMYSVDEYQAEGKPFTMSHGYCKDCGAKVLEKWRATTRRSVIQREREKFLELRAKQKKQVPGEPPA